MPQKPQVSEIALQTDSCDTNHVNKDTLVGYTTKFVERERESNDKQNHIQNRTITHLHEHDPRLMGQERTLS